MRENCTFRLSGGRRQALQWAPPPTRQCGRPCNGAGAKGLRCSALAIGQLETGGACGQGKAVQDPEAGSLGSFQTCEGQPGSGWRRRTVDCGVRGQPVGQPLQALESAVVRELLSSAGTAGRDSKSEWRAATVGYSDAPRIIHLIQFALGMMDEDARNLPPIFADVDQQCYQSQWRMAHLVCAAPLRQRRARSSSGRPTG